MEPLVGAFKKAIKEGDTKKIAIMEKKIRNRFTNLQQGHIKLKKENQEVSFYYWFWKNSFLVYILSELIFGLILK